MNKIFIDADIILDLLLRREPYFPATAKLFSLIEDREVQAFTTPVILANIYYISSKIVNKKSALDYIRKLLSIIKIASIDEKKLCYWLPAPSLRILKIPFSTMLLRTSL